MDFLKDPYEAPDWTTLRTHEELWDLMIRACDWWFTLLSKDLVGNVSLEGVGPKRRINLEFTQENIMLPVVENDIPFMKRHHMEASITTRMLLVDDKDPIPATKAEFEARQAAREAGEEVPEQPDLYALDVEAGWLLYPQEEDGTWAPEGVMTGGGIWFPGVASPDPFVAAIEAARLS